MSFTSSRASDIGHSLALLEQRVPLNRHLLREGDRLYHAGQPFDRLHVLNSGFCKSTHHTEDGREKVGGLHFRGDWLGVDGVATGRYGSCAIALDVSEVWSFRYGDLLEAGAAEPELLTLLHRAVSWQMVGHHGWITSMCTQPADARVARFLLYWLESLADRSLRADEFRLRLSRADIGTFLGMTLESVSRALTRLHRDKVIDFPERSRRQLRICDRSALERFIASAGDPAAAAGVGHSCPRDTVGA
jgi:CRP/FNR family transcriptional regulator